MPSTARAIGNEGEGRGDPRRIEPDLGRQAEQPDNHDRSGRDPVERRDAQETIPKKSPGPRPAGGDRDHQEAAEHEEQIDPISSEGQRRPGALRDVEDHDARRGDAAQILQAEQAAGRVAILHHRRPAPIGER